MEQLTGQRIAFSAQSIKVSITVKNPERKEIVVETNPINLALRPVRPDQRKIILDQNNSGHTNIFLNGPAVIKFLNVWKDSSMDFLVMPGKDFSIVLDAQNRNYVTYGGNWQKENEFCDFMMSDAQRRLDEIPQNDPEFFMQEWKKQNAHNDSLIQIANGAGIDRQYSEWVLQSVHSLFYSALIRQLVNYITVNEKWPVNMDRYIDCCELLNNKQLNNASYFTSESDKDFVSQYYLFETSCQFYNEDKGNVPGLEALYKRAIIKASKVNDPGVKSRMIQYLTKSITQRTSEIDFLIWLKNFLKSQRDSQYYNSVINSRIQVLKVAPKDLPAPAFVAKDSEGVLFSFSKYKGRYIYIDVWATWCIPCKKQISFLEKLKNKYEGKPIDFISISQDMSIDAWKEFLSRNENDAGQFISNPDLAKSINRIYRIEFIPSFILIDPMGNIVCTNCYPPSDPAMDMLLEKLLK